MKKIVSLLLCLVLAAGLCLPAAAFVDHDSLYTAVDSIDNDRLTELGTISLPVLSEQLGFDLRVDIVDSTEDETLEDYAALFYRQYDYGLGENKDGALLMILLGDQGETVDIDGYTVHGGGLGETLLEKASVQTLLSGALDGLLTGEGLSPAEAGAACASGVESFMGVLGSQVMAVNSGVADPEDTEAAYSAEIADSVDTADSAETGDNAEAIDTPAAAAVSDPAGQTEPEAADESPSRSWDELELVGEESDTLENAILAVEASTVGDTPEAGLIRDEAHLLTESQRESLEQEARRISETYGCDTYFLTVDSIGSSGRRDFAKQYYLDHDLGYGDWKNGILFLVAMESREYVTVTYGRNPASSTDYGIGIYAFSDYGIEKLEDQVVPKLSDGDYAGAVSAYLSRCESYLKRYTETGEAFDVGDAPRSKTVPLLITILVPLLIALVVCMIFRGQMKTANAATQADDYIPADSFHLTVQRDQYTHTTQTRRTIERDSDSGGGGGSSVDSGGFGGSSGGHF